MSLYQVLQPHQSLQCAVGLRVHGVQFGIRRLLTSFWVFEFEFELGRSYELLLAFNFEIGCPIGRVLSFRATNRIAYFLNLNSQSQRGASIPEISLLYNNLMMFKTA